MAGGRRWTDKEVELLEELLETELTYKEIGKELERTETAIQRKVSKLGLTGERIYRPLTDKTKNKISQSKKGQTPWNKGLKGVTTAWNKGINYEAIKGKNNGNWNGGKRIREDGYIQILKPEHPKATVEGYVMEHRLVMEKHIGRYLTEEEVVHHKNKDKQDNRIENLKLFLNNSEHQKHHWKLRMESEENGKLGCVNW